MIVLTIFYVLVCLFLILVVLLQAGRGGGMGAAFGGTSQSVFGGAGAGNFLTRLTVVMAATFMLLSATMAYLSSGSDKALEKAAQAVKAREEARKLGPADKKGASAGAAAPASNLSSSPTAPAEGSSDDAPIEMAPVEGAPPVQLQAPTGEQGALEAVDDALKAPQGAKPAKPAAAKKPAPAVDKPAPAAAPANPSPAATPAKPVGEGAPAAPTAP
jgi:preprotein translocase subunit SecG